MHAMSFLYDNYLSGNFSNHFSNEYNGYGKVKKSSEYECEWTKMCIMLQQNKWLLAAEVSSEIKHVQVHRKRCVQMRVVRFA